MKQLEPLELMFLIQATDAAVIKGKDAPMVTHLGGKLRDEYERLQLKDQENPPANPAVKKVS